MYTVGHVDPFLCYLYWLNFDVQDRENCYAFHSNYTTILKTSPISALAVSSLLWDLLVLLIDGCTTIQCNDDSLLQMLCYEKLSNVLFSADKMTFKL